MSYQELIVLLPCHSLEDFPTYLEEPEAYGLLAACTALWHPALIHASRKIPTWCRADVPPLELADRLFVVPQVSKGWLPCDFLERAEAAGAVVVHGVDHRADIVKAALAKVSDVPAFDANIEADFFALGFCRLQVELITRVMRYSSTIDDIRLQTEALTALDAAITGEKNMVAEALQRGFDHLCESRRYYYPTDPYLIDLTLVAETTIGDSLRTELAWPVPKNLLICGEVLERLEEQEGASRDAIKSALERNELSLVGGEYEEREFPLLPEETWREDLLRGIATYERILGRRPVVYGRRRAGLSPLLPQLLCRTGFQAALHFTLDDGQFPTSPNAKVRWDSADGSVVEAIAQVPFDASRSTPFLELPRRLGDAMDRDQVATMVFAHWPGMSSNWYDDLRRAARFTPALGKMITLEEYFSTTATTTNFVDFKDDDYKTPYLRQVVAAGKINPSSAIAAANIHELQARNRKSFELIRRPICEMMPTLNDDPFVQWESGNVSRPLNKEQAVSYVEINPNSFAIQRTVMSSCLSREVESGKPLVWPEPATVDDTEPVITVPGMGFTWVDARRIKINPKQVSRPVKGGCILRNEFCEVIISATTGGIQSIRDFRTRGNRLSQQIALRRSARKGIPGFAWRDPDQDAAYSVMVADLVDTSDDNRACEGVSSSGRLVDQNGNQLAKFRQLTWLRIGSPIIELSIELEIDELPHGDSWSNYYCSRFAFPNTEVQWFRNVGLEVHETTSGRIESPLLVEGRAERWRTVILSGGIPYHRRVQERTLETLLVVPGESARKFSLGIGIDVSQPVTAAIELMTVPEVRYALDCPPPTNRAAWLFHLDSKNVVATAWEPMENGFRVRLRETLVQQGGSACARGGRFGPRGKRISSGIPSANW